MIKDLVKGAIHIKMGSTSRNDLISKGEFSYAVGLALSILKEEKTLKDEVLTMETISQIKTKVVEKVQKAYDGGGYERKYKTLFYMIIECKLDGEMTEELRELILMGYNNLRKTIG